MGDVTPLQGELQMRLMAVLWGLGSGTVEDVRKALPKSHRGAYTTVQTVLNRLAERGLLARDRQGAAFVYRPQLSESEYLSRSIEHTLSGASETARRAALAQLIGTLSRDELSDVQRVAEDIDRARGRRR